MGDPHKFVVSSLTFAFCTSLHADWLMLVQESILAIASMASKHHKRDFPVWPGPWVCIAEDRDRHDIPAIWIWVNEILLDSSNEALLLDCCVLPVDRLGDEVCSQLKMSAAANLLFTKVRSYMSDVIARISPIAVLRTPVPMTGRQRNTPPFVGTPCFADIPW